MASHISCTIELRRYWTTERVMGSIFLVIHPLYRIGAIHPRADEPACPSMRALNTHPGSVLVKYQRPEFDAFARRRVGRGGRIDERSMRHKAGAAVGQGIVALQ